MSDASSAADRAKPRVLFCSYHSYFDPGSGAALSTRDLLEWLARHAWHCRVFCGAELDGAEGAALPALLAAQQVPYDVQHGHAGALPFALYHFMSGGVPVAVYQAPDVQPGRAPTPAEGQSFLTLFEWMLAAFRPDVLLTFGGHWFAPTLMQRARQRGVRVVFCLKNCNYHSAELFRETDAVLVLSEYCREHYRRTLGLECTVLPSLIDETRVRSPSVQGRYVTFVNPLPHKGAAVFARIAHELGRRRPDIPLLLVESRAKAAALQAVGLDFRGRTNLFVMEQTPDPRDFYQVSKLVLMPSLWQEAFGRVAVEACLNGIPVLASRRGALPEVLAHAGFLFDVPDRCTPEANLIPTVAEVEPWIQTICKLWDDPAFYAQERQRCLAAAEAWRSDRIGAGYAQFLKDVIDRPSRPSDTTSPPPARSPAAVAEAERLFNQPIPVGMTAPARTPAIIRPYQLPEPPGSSFWFGPGSSGSSPP